MIPRVNTPWGWTDSLRENQLRPGPGLPSDVVANHQRDRMYAGAVAAVSVNGYRDTRVADIVRISGVSRSAFYRRFDNKAHCFRETARAIWESADLPEFGVVGMPDVIGWADAYPACAMFALNAPDDMGQAALEREIEAWHRTFARRWGCPPLVARAVVAAAFRLTASRLERGAGVMDLADTFDLMVSAYGVGAPAISVARRRRHTPTALAAVPTEPLHRLVEAVTAELDEHGGTTVIRVTSRAKASLSTFYAVVESLDELTDLAEREARSKALSAARSVDEWLTWLAGHPAHARLAILYRPFEKHTPFVLRAEAGLGSGVEAEVADAVVTALLAEEIRGGRGGQLHNLEPLVDQLLRRPIGASRTAVAA